MSLQSTCFLVFFALCVMMMAFVAAADDNEMFESKEVAEKRPFFVGSRYGRSSNPHRQVVARNDKFFLGSRYGKRSPANDDGFPAIRIQTPEVTCLYTGVLNLYKCFGNVQEASEE
ncbi:RYamide neuropeptides [Culicoides brevitarsis]|uniref:RYamide neuropeptides n=1 Tax=Culicoides brevitarsis TaxID=469753 RepID=UPI00307B9689